MANMFSLEHGVIPACDIIKLDDLKDLVNKTDGVEGIVGYKIGKLLGLKHSLPQVCEVMRETTDKPIIYDHQKFGTDVPSVDGGEILDLFKESGVIGVIIFPESGSDTLKAAVNGCKERGLVPIVGGEMTHNYTVSQGGYIADNSPERMYVDAVNLGVNGFIVPGTKYDSMAKYKKIIGEKISDPWFGFPGIGSQGGDIEKAFEAVKPYSSYAIVGGSIYKAKDRTAAAETLCRSALSVE